MMRASVDARSCDGKGGQTEACDDPGLPAPLPQPRGPCGQAGEAPVSAGAVVPGATDSSQEEDEPPPAPPPFVWQAYSEGNRQWYPGGDHTIVSALAEDIAVQFPGHTDVYHYIWKAQKQASAPPCRSLTTRFVLPHWMARF